MTEYYSQRQRMGTEFGGVDDPIAGGIQEKGTDTLTPADKLRLGYRTGVEDSTQLVNIDDLRQFVGLRPADGRRPWFIEGASPVDDPRLDSEAERLGFGAEE